MPPKLQQLKSILETLNNGVGKAEFVASFKAVLEQIKKLEQQLLLRIDKRSREYDFEFKEMISDFQNTLEQLKQTLEKAQKESDSTIGGIWRRSVEYIENVFVKNKINQKLQAALTEVENTLTRINKITSPVKGVDYFDGEPGKTPTKEELEEIIKPLIPTLPEFQPRAEEVIGLDKFVRDRIPQRSLGGGGTSDMGVKFSLGRIIQKETPSGLINGVNTVYTVQSEIHAIFSFTINGEAITDDLYTVAGHTITFTTALDAALTGTSFRIVYV